MDLAQAGQNHARIGKLGTDTVFPPGQPSRSFFASELIELTGSGSAAVQRKISPTLYTTNGYGSRRASSNPFLNRVLEGEHLVLIGSEDTRRELENLVRIGQLLTRVVCEPGATATPTAAPRVIRVLHALRLPDWKSLFSIPE